MSNEWRPILAALANPEARRVYAEIVLDSIGQSALPAKRRARAVDTLTAAGLVTIDDDGTARAISEAMIELLAHAAEPKREGTERFVRDGRIEQYPAKPGERLALLEWVAGELLHPGEAIGEDEINDRLARYHDDVASLRRYLVDAGLLQRTPDGRSYQATR